MATKKKASRSNTVSCPFKQVKETKNCYVYESTDSTKAVGKLYLRKDAFTEDPGEEIIILVG